MKIPAIVSFACLVSHAYAQQTPPVSSIRVTGDAVVFVKPERAQIDVGVLTQERQSQAAQSQNTKQLDSVMAALRRVLGPDADIKTVSASLSPNYQYRSFSAQPPISGYTAINVVRVTLDDLGRVGAVIDAATQAGANHVESVQYTVRDLQPVRAQALREATLKAKADAEALASALNVRIVRVVSVEESRDNGVPLADSAQLDARALGSDAGPAPSLGGLEIPASVILTFEVSTGPAVTSSRTRE